MKWFQYQRKPRPETPETCDEPEWKSEYALKEVESILKHSRWEVSEDPVGGDEAIALYTEAIELDSTLVEAYVNRSAAYRGLGRFDEALDDAMKAIELEPTDVNVLARVYANRSLALGDLGRLDQALDDAMKAIELEPTHLSILAQAYAVRARARATLGRDAEAEADLAEAFELGLMEACDFGT